MTLLLNDRLPPGTVALETALRRTAPRALHPAAAVIGGVKVHGRSGVSVRALDGVDLQFERGHFTAIMGPSGSGKSTLLHCLAGLDTLTAGRVVLGDVDLGTLDDASLTRLRRDRIGFIFQAFNLLPTLNAADNITLPLSLAGRKPDRAWFDHVVEAVALGDRLQHRPAELSGGQQQRVAAARALISRPEIVFADEPTGSLDSKSSADLLGFLRRAATELEQTIVMVTHDPLAASVADRVVFLVDGRVDGEVRAPTATDVIEQMKRLEAA